MNTHLFDQFERLVMRTDTFYGHRLLLRLAWLNLLKALDNAYGKPYILPIVEWLNKQLLRVTGEPPK